MPRGWSDKKWNPSVGKHLTQTTLAGKLAYCATFPSKVAALDGTRIRDIVSGADHILAMSDRGEVLTWGAGDAGELGHGDKKSHSTPLILGPLREKKIRQVFSGSSHSLALTETGELFSWGQGGAGQLGHDELKNCKIPRLVVALKRSHVLQVAA